MKTILVTGASGFLGRTIVEELTSPTIRIRCAVRSLQRAEHLLRSDIELCLGDLSDPEFTRKAVHGTDTIIHAAAQLGGWGNVKEFRRNNVEATFNLMNAAMAERISHVVYISSAASYGRQANTCLTEASAVRHEHDPYCETKLHCEELVRSACERTGIRGTILRPSIIYGPYDRRFLIPIIQHMRKGTMLAIGKRNQGPPLVYGKDVAALIHCLLAQSSSGVETYNVCSHEVVSWEEIVQQLGDALQLPTGVKRIPYSVAYGLGSVMEWCWNIAGASHPPLLTRFLVGLIGLQYSFDSSKALAVEGFTGFTPFSRGLRDTLEWICAEEHTLRQTSSRQNEMEAAYGLA